MLGEIRTKINFKFIDTMTYHKHFCVSLARGGYTDTGNTVDLKLTCANKQKIS